MMSSRPPVFTWNEELHFGPPSEPVHIQGFFDEVQKLYPRGLSSPLYAGVEDKLNGILTGWKEWSELSEGARNPVETDCSLDDIKSSLRAVLSSQKHVSYLQRTHATAVSVFTSPQPSARKGGKHKKPPTARDHIGLEPLKLAIEKSSLKIWKLTSAAKPYIRPNHVSEQNALDTLNFQGDSLAGIIPPQSHEILITLTVYTRNSWYPFAFSRNSQHVLPSLSTLADVWGCISCALKGDGGMPSEVIECDVEDSVLDCEAQTKKIVGYNLGDSKSDQDSVVMLIEDMAYSDGRRSPDYADKLISHLEVLKSPRFGPSAPPPLPPGPYERPKRSMPLQKGSHIRAVPLRSLTLRINEPYWVLHRGSCEHWFVIDEIRLQNPRDPPSGYPIGLQRTPTFRPLCRICSKVPATLSILNDVRLGESPSMLCSSCWELFGGPPQSTVDDKPDTRIVVVPIVVETS